MLAPHEFTIGPLSNAAGMTLLLARGEHEASMLITDAPGASTAIILDGEFRFASLGAAGNTSWGGILVPNITLEIDETSVTDPRAGRPPGSVIRKQTQLCIVAQDRPRGRQTYVPLIAGLPPCHEQESAGFTRWCVIIGEGLNRRVIKAIDVTAA